MIIRIFKVITLLLLLFYFFLLLPTHSSIRLAEVERLKKSQNPSTPSILIFPINPWKTFQIRHPKLEIQNTTPFNYPQKFFVRNIITTTNYSKSKHSKHPETLKTLNNTLNICSFETKIPQKKFPVAFKISPWLLANHPQKSYTISNSYSFPLLSQLKTKKYHQTYFEFEFAPSLSFTIFVPYHWNAIPIKKRQLSLPNHLNVVAQFCQENHQKIIPFTEVSYLSLGKDINPLDWLLWYAEQYQLIILNQNLEQGSHSLIASLLFQKTIQGYPVIGRLSSFQNGDKLWVISSLCLEAQYQKEREAFAIFAGSVRFPQQKPEATVEWKTTSFPPLKKQTFIIPNKFKIIENQKRILFERADRQDTSILLTPNQNSTPLDGFQLKFSTYLKAENKEIRLKHFSSLTKKDYIVLKFKLNQQPYQLEMIGPNREEAPLAWMENKFTLEKLFASLLK